MTEQHRSTAEQWREAKENKYFTCLLELRDRIEALEATQHAHVDLSHLSDAEQEKILNLLANPSRFEVLEVAQPAKSNYPEKLDSSLVEDVAAIIDNGTACGRDSDRIARAAIRAVAVWVRKHKQFGAAVWSQRLKEEAER
jgi:hypothetical protein